MLTDRAPTPDDPRGVAYFGPAAAPSPEEAERAWRDDWQRQAFAHLAIRRALEQLDAGDEPKARKALGLALGILEKKPAIPAVVAAGPSHLLANLNSCAAAPGAVPTHYVSDADRLLGRMAEGWTPPPVADAATDCGGSNVWGLDHLSDN